MDVPGEFERQAELKRMKRFATGLLAIVSLVSVAASLFEPRYPWLAFVRATAEAAMVGAIADWFAVTALFRHPLGLPIPHTAIIARRKDSIGASIARFAQENFLSEAVILDRLRSVNIAQHGARWISQPSASAQIARLLAAGIAGIAQVLNDADVQALIERALVARLRTVQAAPLLGRVLALILSERRRAELLYALLGLLPDCCRRTRLRYASGSATNCRGGCRAQSINRSTCASLMQSQPPCTRSARTGPIPCTSSSMPPSIG
jgi:uncharacterized membrane-anchored protein YjiN (DUF445 family)